MRLNNNNKIISEDDIILSDGSSTLSERINSQQEQINQLKSNVKWIYKYGGVGSGNGSGGSTIPFSIYATLNDVQLKSQNLVLSNQGIYTLYIKINNPNNGQFNVQVQYSTISSKGVEQKITNTKVLSIENNYTWELNVNLNNNASLIVVATDGSDIQQTSCNYITQPYIFNTSLIDDNDKVLKDEIFISDAKLNGVNVKLDYTISVNAEVKYTYDFNGTTVEGNITDKNNSLLFAIPKELFNEVNAGYYTFNLNISVTPENQEAINIQKVISFSLIPQQIYALVTPQTGQIYKQEESDPYLFNAGYIAFNYRIYQGTNENRFYNVTVYLNDNQVLSYTAQERVQEQFTIFTNKEGVNKLTINVSRGVVYTITYYFYIKASTLKLDWFKKDWTQYYYRITQVTNNFEQYRNKTFIEQTINSPTINIHNIEAPTFTGNTPINTHIAIGLQYNSINTKDSTIIQFFKDSSSPILELTQQTIKKTISKNLYIKPQDNADSQDINKYHLISIYSQFVKQVDNTLYYELSAYIDGKLETVFPQLYDSPLLITDITIPPVNCYINLLDVDFKEGTLDDDGDYDVYNFFLKYNSFILGKQVESDAELLQYLNNFNVGLNGRVTTDYATINNIASQISTPIMLLTYEHQGDNDFMDTLEQSYSEEGVGSDLSFNVTIQWSSGNQGLTSIDFPGDYSTAQFLIEIQGSSTKEYKIKNFNLSIVNTDDSEQADIFLYSPNYKDGDTSTFLPENSFTLKADVSDSSHSNNTSCGKFVNTVCNKFSTNDKSYHSKYIRNCLEGFPFLMFLNVVTTDKITQDKTSTYYYLGIYNFNLGRNSYYNLGYKNLDVFGTNKSLLSNASNSFTLFKINKSEDSLKEGLGVAEIQGGSNYFDFSQFDSSLLFKKQLSGDYEDTTYMFGDMVWGKNSTELNLQKAITTLVQNVAYSGGFLFDYLKKNKGSYSDGYNKELYVNGVATGKSLNQVPNYQIQYVRKISSTGTNVYEEKETIRAGQRTDLQTLIIPDTDQNIPENLNYQSLSEYYTICMIFGLVDSVMKNLNIKTWDLKTWVIAFYDMDTCFGLNNAGQDKVTYFAFTDYWLSNCVTNNGIDYPTEATIYRDFCPIALTGDGYDIPSSYLFAVAKYARLIFNTDINTQNYPQELYAKWRSNNINTSTNEGVLKNADYFMEHFFSNNLGSINPLLVSYNYRSKYITLAKNSTTWVSTDYEKFNGTRINQVRDWLNGRLHILDAYFNLNRNIINTFSYLEGNQDDWRPLEINGANVTDLVYSSPYAVQANEDVIILHDIFSDNGQGIQLSGNVKIMLKCPEYSPLQIRNANNSIKYNYILGGDNWQQIEFTPTGNQFINLGGSQNWNELQSIDWISTGSLTITSNNLSNIQGSQGSFTAIELNTPNIKTIELNSAKYSGRLDLETTTKFPNLNIIDISNSKLGLVANNLNVSQINISNIQNSSAEIDIRNCNKLASFKYTNIILKSLTLQNINYNIGTLTFNNTQINTLNLSCSESGCSVIINNDSAIEQIELTGFSAISITNCPKLRKVIINDTNTLKVHSLQIKDCINQNLYITSTTASSKGLADLQNLTELNSLSLSGSYNIVHIYLPSNISLQSNAFSNLRNLETVDGQNIIINGTSIFYNCAKYGLKSSSGSYTNFKVNSTLTSLANTFWQDSDSTAITYNAAKYFIENCIPKDNALTNVQGLFARQKGIVYTKDDLIKHLSGNKNHINMTHLSHVTDAQNMFYGCSFAAYNKDTLNFGANSLNINQIFSENTDVIYTTIDVFDNIITKITSLSFYRSQLTFIDTSGNVITSNIPLKDFFNPNGQIPTKLSNISYFQSSNTLDMQDVFTSEWTSLTSIVNSFSGKMVNIDQLLYDLPNLRDIRQSFNSSNTDRVDLYTFLNWENFCRYNGQLELIWSTLTLKKSISEDNFIKLCNLLIKSKMNSISYIFSNCNLLGNPEILTFGDIEDQNTSIQYLESTFSNFKIINNDTELPINLSPTFFKNLVNIIDVGNLFYGCYFKSAIPFNLFNKRRIDTTINRNVYVKVLDEYKPTTLTIYTYARDIKWYSGLFQNCKWVNIQYDPSLYDIPKNKVELGDYDVYYTKNKDGSFTEHQLIQNTEITDTENLIGYYTQSYASEQYNFTLQGDSNKLIVPPDLFYGASVSALNTYGRQIISLNNALNCSTPLQGIIPRNLLKNCKTASISNLFKDQDVIPQLVNSYKDEDKLVNIYSCFPLNYTNYTLLDNAFNCIPVVPINSTSETNWVFMIMQESINKETSSMDNAFYMNRQFYGGNNNYINYIGNIQDGTVSEGLDTSYFTKLTLDYIYYSPLNIILYGRLFNSQFDAKNINMSNSNSKVIANVNNWGLSSNIIYPLATGQIRYLALTNVTYGFSIKASQIISSNSSKQYYKDAGINVIE